jgi:hypothetical protein
MKFIKSLFRKKRKIKACQVYKTQKSYKILTMYRQESWAFLSSKPIYQIPIESDLEKLSSKIFESINHSRSIKEKEENSFWLGKNLLEELNENSFNELYKESTSCIILLENNILEITPYRYAGRNKGMEEISEKTIKVKFLQEKQLDITKKIVHILEQKNT